jgi:hypothetical protein
MSVPATTEHAAAAIRNAIKTGGLKKPGGDVDFFINGANAVDHSVAVFA